MSVPEQNCCVQLGENRFKIGRFCIVCGDGFNLMGIGDPRTICPDCCKAIKTIKDNSKRNWIPDSKGVEHNHR